MATNVTIDFTQIANEYASVFKSNHNTQGDPLKDVQLSEADIACIKFEAKDVHWDPACCVEQSESLPVQSGQGCATTERRMYLTSRVRLTDGVCAGTENVVRLTPPGNTGMESLMVEVNPADGGNQEKSHPTDLEVPSTGARGTAYVEASIQKRVFNGTFSCKVYPKGTIGVTARKRNDNSQFGGSLKVQPLLAEMKRLGKSSVRELHEDSRGKVYWVLKGHYFFNLDAQLRHEWS